MYVIRDHCYRNAGLYHGSIDNPVYKASDTIQ